MTCGNAEGWLILGDIEIANEARLRSYLDNGETKYNPNGIPDPNCCLGCSGFSFTGGYCEYSAWDPCLNNGAGGFLTYERPDGLTGASGDPAPWFDANDPDSADFLGVWIYEMAGWDSTTKREVIPQRFGSGFGAERKEGREVVVRAKLFATSCCGMEYGKRWLNRVLSSSQDGKAGSCCTFDATIRTCCEGSDPDKGLYNLCDVAVTDGFTIVNDDSDACPKCSACCDCDVEWTMHVGNPFLFGCEEVCGGGTYYPIPFACGAIPLIEKGSFTPEVDVGECAQFFIIVENDSDAVDDWENVVVEDFMLPAWALQGGTTTTTQGTVTSGAGFGDNFVQVQVGDIPPGGSVTIQYNACLTAAGAQGTRNTAIATGDNGGPIVDFNQVPFSGGCNCVPTVDLPTGPCQILSPTTYTVSYPAGCDASDYQTPTWFVDGTSQSSSNSFTVFPWTGGGTREIKVFILGNGNCLNEILLEQSSNCTSTLPPTCDCTFTSDLPTGACTIAAPVTYTLTPGPNCDTTEYGTPVWTIDGTPYTNGLSININPVGFTNGPHVIAVSVPGAGVCTGLTIFTDQAQCTFSNPTTCSCNFSVDFPTEPCQLLSTTTYTLTETVGLPNCDYDPPIWQVDGVQVGTGTSIAIDPNAYTAGPHTVRVLVNGDGPCQGVTLFDEDVTCTFGVIVSNCANCVVNVTPPLAPPCNINSVTVYQVGVTGCAPTEWANPEWYVDGNLVGTGTFFVLDPNAYSSGIHSVRLLINGEGLCLGQVIYDQTVQCSFPAMAPARIASSEEDILKICENVLKWLDRREMSEEEFVKQFEIRTDSLGIPEMDDWCENGYPDGFAEIAADIFGVKPSSITGRRA